MTIPEVASVGRRTGRAELDEHAEGVHFSEVDVDLKPSSRSRGEILGDIRKRLAVLPASVSVGQPIAHRMDHMLSGIRAEIALKVYGEDLDTLRNLAETMQGRLASVQGLADLQMEKQSTSCSFASRPITSGEIVSAIRPRGDRALEGCPTAERCRRL